MSYQKVIIVDNEGEPIIVDKGEDYKSSMMRNAVSLELAQFGILTINHREFEKTSYERELIVRCKKRWRGDMKATVPNWTRKSDYYLEKRTL